MRLLIFLGSMVLAGVIEYLLWQSAISFFEWRFLRKAKSILLLYDATLQILQNKFNDNNSMKISLKYEHCGNKIKFRNALEASLKIELLIHKALKNYYIIKWLIDADEENLEEFQIEDAKKKLEEICYEMRNIVNTQEQEFQNEEL